MSIISLKNVSKLYGKRQILSNTDFCVKKGELAGIIGRSGLGKTTLLNLLGLIDKLDSGEYYFNNRLINYKDERKRTELRRDHIGFVVQDYALIKDRNVFYNIALPLMSKNISKKHIKEKIEALAENLKISDLINRYPYEISGGEAQRVAIARALIRNPEIILADEPTGALDESAETEVLELLKSLNKTGVSILIVTHNPVVADICTQTYTLLDGQIVPC